jgi:hypothetical protein
MTVDLKQQEEIKRNRQWEPNARRRVLQATLNWVEAQGTVRRNTPQERIKDQARKLAKRLKPCAD